MTNPGLDLGPGIEVPGFTITGNLGSGQMGTVYLATQDNLARLVALKVIKPGNSAARPIERFHREARLLAATNHPNIVTVFEAGHSASGHMWIAMEYVRGMSAAELLRAGPATPDQVQFVVNGAAAGLDHAWERSRILHRDVKPANIMLEVTDDGYMAGVKLTDFGVARQEDEPNLTDHGHVIGTHSFLPPEAYTFEPSGHAGDIYALAVTAYVMLAGDYPFGQGQQAWIRRHVDNSLLPPLVSESNPLVPLAADRVLRKALAFDPGDRYASALEFAAALESALSAGPEQAPAHRTGDDPAGHSPATGLPRPSPHSAPTLCDPDGEPTVLRPPPPDEVTHIRGARRWSPSAGVRRRGRNVILGAAAAVAAVAVAIGAFLALPGPEGDRTPLQRAVPPLSVVKDAAGENFTRLEVGAPGFYEAPTRCAPYSMPALDSVLGRDGVRAVYSNAIGEMYLGAVDFGPGASAAFELGARMDPLESCRTFQAPGPSAEKSVAWEALPIPNAAEGATWFRFSAAGYTPGNAVVYARGPLLITVRSYSDNSVSAPKLQILAEEFAKRYVESAQG